MKLGASLDESAEGVRIKFQKEWNRGLDLLEERLVLDQCDFDCLDDTCPLI